MVVQMTVGELRELIRQAVAEQEAKTTYEKLLTPEQLSKALGVPVSWIYEQSRQRHLPTHRMGKYIRFDLCEVIASQKPKL